MLSGSLPGDADSGGVEQTRLRAGSTEICGVPVAEERIETSARVARGKIASEIADAAEIVGSARRIRHDDRTRGVPDQRSLDRVPEAVRILRIVRL